MLPVLFFARFAARKFDIYSNFAVACSCIQILVWAKGIAHSTQYVGCASIVTILLYFICKIYCLSNPLLGFSSLPQANNINRHKDGSIIGAGKGNRTLV